MNSALFDPKVPLNLARMQLWFGSIIRQKMNDDRSIPALAPNKKEIQEEACRYVVNSPQLAAWERMQIYQQSYWLRLLEVLREEFPMLHRLFGEDDFDKTLGIPYLDCHPPSHWSLSLLAAHFTKWVNDAYHANDKALVTCCAELDWACQELFIAKEAPRIDLSLYQGENSELLLQKKLTLQPTVRLLEFPGHLLHFRKALLEHPVEHWHNTDFPKIEKGKTFYFILFRGISLVTEWLELPKEAYLILRELETGQTIEEACDRVRLDDVEEQIPFWLQEWLVRNWLTEY